MNHINYEHDLKLSIKHFSPKEQNIILEAYNFARKKHARQKRRSGEPYINHPVRVAIQLSSNKYDKQSIIAGLLHDTIEDTNTKFTEIEDKFGFEIANIVDGVTKISNIKVKKSLIFSDEDLFMNQVDNYRKILLATISDLRIIIIKLFDRMDNIETIEFIDQKKRKFYARETIEIFAPIAERLGMGELKGALEDKSFPYAYPDDYLKFLPILQSAYKNPEDIINNIIPRVSEAIKNNGLKCFHVAGRAKHHYSLYQKLKIKESIDQIFDIVALRVIVKNIEDCYKILGIIHSLYQPLPGRIFDYIARPMQNGYQSIHTTVKDRQGNIFEIQIRTEEMHFNAEYGQCSHWNYKENNTPKSTSEWLNELKKIEEIKSGKELIKQIKEELFSQKIFVFTPKGEIVDLPINSTGIDFAYKIHSDIGDSCSGIKINGRMMPLKTELRTGDTIEIITSNKARPTKDWLKYAKTSGAKTKIRNSLRVIYFDEFRNIGQTQINDLITKFNLPLINNDLSDKLINESTLTHNDYASALAAIGEGYLSKYKVIKILYPGIFQAKKNNRTLGTQRVVHYDSLAGIKYNHAKCCNPIMTDKVMGYLSSSHVIKVHKIDCPRIKNVDRRRIINVC